MVLVKLSLLVLWGHQGRLVTKTGHYQPKIPELRSLFKFGSGSQSEERSFVLFMTQDLCYS